MNREGRSGVYLAVLWTALFIPEFFFYLLAYINYRIWDRFYKMGKLSIRRYWLKNRAQVWFYREHESIEDNYLTTIGANMAIRTNSKIKTYRWSPSAEKDVPDHEKTVFLLKDLKHSEAVDVGDNLFGLDEITGNVDRLRAQTLGLKMVLKRLTGWENLYDENGEPVKFPSNKADLLRILDEIANAAPDVVNELTRAFGGADGKGQN